MIHIVEFERIKALQMQGFCAIMKKSQKSRICLSERVPGIAYQGYPSRFRGLTHMRKQKTKWRKET